MRPINLMSIAKQVAAHLREEILRGSLAGEMPGAKTLAATLEVNHKTVDAAANLLEQEGFLQSQGPGKPRRIILPKNAPSPVLHLSILLFDQKDRKVHYIIDLQNRLSQAGHVCTIASKSLTELRMSPQRIGRIVKKSQAEAWIVVAAPREVLEWFAKQTFPTFSLFGNLGPLPLARSGPQKGPTVISTVRHLTALGHTRIVMLVREENLKPKPGVILRQFLEELEAQGICSGRYNLPEWKDDPESFQQCLISLFQHTPPTALLIDEQSLCFVVLQFLAERGIAAPRDISLICLAPDSTFLWCNPVISHIDYNSDPWVRRAAKWADNVARGKEDRQQELTEPKLIEGGTIGPAPSS